MKYTPLLATALALGISPLACADVLLSEVMTDNVATLMDEDGDLPDWIELHNTETAAVDLAGYFLSDDPEDLNKWELPAIELAGNGYLVVFASGKDRRALGSNLHSNFQLKNGGEYLALTLPDKTTIADAYEPEIPQLKEDQSYGVQLSGGKFVAHFFNTATPNAMNEDGTVAEEVIFSVSGEPFVGSMQLELSSRSGSAITYSTDGNAPTLFNGKTYSSPITLNKTTIITAAISRGPFRQEVYAQVTPELANFSSNLPLVIMTGAGTFSTNYQDMLIGVLEPGGEQDRTTVAQPFSLTSRGIARTRGSSTQEFPKKSYRVEFQDVKGEGRVLKPLGMPAESDWILSGRYEEDRSLVRNEFIYDISNQIGRYAARTVFCEVYVHSGDGPVGVGDYVGAYSFMESIKRDADRIDIDELLPGQDAEPEVTGGYIFKVDRSGPTETTVTGGTQSVNITDPSRSDLSAAQRAYLIAYLNDMKASFESSDPETGYPAYIDAPSWIDHHLLNMLMLNVDALRLSTFFYKERNGKVFGGPIWDFNISSGSRDRFGSPPRPRDWNVWQGISGDRGTDFFGNGTQRWWGDLFELRDFQQAYCDRWHELRAGAFSTENLLANIDSKMAELSEAQPRNEARWPQVRPEYGGWQGEIDHLKDWIAHRVEWVDDELVKPPTSSPAGGQLADGATVRLSGHRGNLFSPTSLYYTTDGSDPRLPGGGISPVAIKYGSAFALTESATLTVREYMPNYKPEPKGPAQEWSAPASIQFVVGGIPAAAGNVVLSELMYHPSQPTETEIAAGFTNDDDFEFIEFTNISDGAIDWLGISFNDGIRFEALAPLTIAPGEQVVIVSHPEAFHFRYGDAIAIAGSYTGNLRNSGDDVRLLGADGSVIVDLEYDDRDPWPETADGDGYSLVLNDPAGDPNVAATWRASKNVGGSPGMAEDGGGQQPGVTYAEWAMAAITDAADRGTDADPDGDGSVNLAEFLLGTDPMGADVPSINASADGQLTVTYQRRAGITGTEAVIQVSPNLTTWTDAAAASTETSSNGAWDLVTATWPLAADEAARYVRLKIRHQ